METLVYSIRLSKEIRKMIEEMEEINWQAELRRLIEEKVREEYKRRILSEAREIRKKMTLSIASH